MTSGPCSSFEELFEKVLTYKELSHANFARQMPQFALVNVVAGAFVGSSSQGRDRRDKQKHEKNQHVPLPRDEAVSRKWSDPKAYTFDIEDTERWFDALVKKGKIMPFTPKELM